MVQYYNDSVGAPRFTYALHKGIFFNHQQAVKLSYKSPPSIKFLFEGEVEYSSSNQTTTLRPGQLLYIPPGQYITTKIRKRAKGVGLFFSDALELNFLSDWRYDPIPLIDSPLSASFDLINPKSIHLLDFDQWQNATIHNLIHYQLQLVEYENRLQYKRQATRKDILKRLLHSRQYIEKHFQQAISLEQIARKAGLSKFLYIRRFTEVFLLSPHQFLLKTRIDKAKYLLIHSTQQLTGIAHQCGFSNLSHFSKTFKQHIGKSPSEFRKDSKECYFIK